ncbi:MAG TPA: hypothetical protein VGV62_09060 [Xanthobacteraceae bacterium]|nr:hypothetical protein [Xanthobacteraceae bacterium]
MRDIFACRECQSIYEITRVSEPPVLAPFCRNCGCKFPPSELGDWLAYERAEPEWTVDAWLRGAPEIPHHVSYDQIVPLNQPLSSPLNKYQAPGAFQPSTPVAAEATMAAQATLPSARLRRLAPFVVRT